MSKIKDKLRKATQKLKSLASSSSSDAETDALEDAKTDKSKSTDSGESSSSLMSTAKNNLTTDDENDDEDGEINFAEDKNFGKRKILDADKPATWNVLVRVIEAKDVEAGSSRVSASLDGKVKMTRTVTHAVPKWRQNLLFTKKNISLEKLSACFLTIRLAHPHFTGETIIGDFSCYMSEVIHCTDKSVIGKWVALGVAGEEDDPDELVYENCGFLKLSICVYRIDESPPQLVDDDGTEQIWSGAHISDYTLKFRIFNVKKLLRKYLNEKKSKKQQKFYIMVECGSNQAATKHEVARVLDHAETAEINFEQEIYLPIQWPTVISQIKISMFAKQGRKKTCMGQTSLEMRKIYEPGETGFLPSFGPAYVNIFDSEKVTKFNWFLKKTSVLHEDGSRFVARLFFSIECVEYMGESTSQRMFLDHSSIKDAENFTNDIRNYNCFCSMTGLNMINPLFAKDSIQILVSIGSFGSISAESQSPSSSTMGAIPNFDGCKYFAMPWGNMRPVTEVDCFFEDIEDRIEISNSFSRMVNMLDQMIGEVMAIGNGATDHIASLGCETLEYLEQMIEHGVKYLESIIFRHSNNLDRNWLETRKRKIIKLKKHLDDEVFNIDYSEEEVDVKLLRFLNRIRDLAQEMADDVQLSIPPVTIKMMSFGKLIGFAKVPISEIFQADQEAKCGVWCGRTRPINIKWPTLCRKEEFIAVLRAKMWFGRKEVIDKWKEIVDPAEVRHFMDLYEVQNKSMMHNWKSSESKPFLNGNLKEVEKIPAPFFGWKTAGNWIVMNTHAMWMPEAGRETIHDKAYEVQVRDDNGDWQTNKYTGYYGDELKESDLKKGVRGWEVTTWTADKLRNNGDKHGWVYSTNGTFFGNDIYVDREMKPHHHYRRRCITRTRKLIAYNKDNEQFENYRNSLGDTQWEHSNKQAGPYHDEEDSNSQYRRRRFMIEMEHEEKHVNAPLYRIYEYQLVTAKWQLRCYIMWAKDLLPVVKNSARAFVRISFDNFSRQTLLVDNSINPIWNETVIIRDILIAGGTRDIMTHPPIVSCEVVGECENNAEAHLGRFETPPMVICSITDEKAHPQWYPLNFPNGRTRGAVLACFELYEHDPNRMPLEPQAKFNHEDKFEIPPELRPDFDKYHVQFLCWGVRNVKKYQLLSVRKPFVELNIGDQEFILEPLKDIRKNPNFPEPMVTFSEVALPSALELSPPFVVNLFDARSFNRKPMIGTCLINNLNRNVPKIMNKNKSGENMSWRKFNETIDDEQQQLISMVRRPVLSIDPMVPLDWWSRYYSSLTQFHRAPGYLESGMELLKVFKKPLEQVNGYNNFSDFLDTLTFVKNSKGDFDDPEEKEKVGELKCRLLISKLKKNWKPETMNAAVDFLGPVKCLVRVYVIEAQGLITNSNKGRVDAYAVVKCGKETKDTKKNYRAENADPIFGELVEMTVTIPLEKDLIISVFDKRRLLSDEEIGTTTIDLENRLLTKWRATCGISAQYTVQGEMQWRDQMTPLELMRSYCIRMSIPPPTIVTRPEKDSKVEKTEYGIMIYGVTFWYSEVLSAIEKEEEELLENQREKAGKDNESFEESLSIEEKMEIERAKSKKERERKKKESKRSTKESKEKIDENELRRLRNTKRAEISGTQLEMVACFILRQINLVPEHVETRPLTSLKNGKSVRGNIRMFVDIFPLEYGPIPAPFNISPRKPVKYQLRVAILDVSGAIPVKRSFEEPVSDLYVKIFVNGMQKGQKTDTHFRVMDGNGEFNWRCLLDFEYNPWEKKIVAKTKTRLFRKAVEELVDPIVVFQLWDKQLFKKDRMLGEMEMDLHEFIEAIGSPKDIGIYTKKKKLSRCAKCRKTCICQCCMFCFETRCFCRRRKIVKTPFPKPKKYAEANNSRINLFDARSICGWWPMLTNVYPHTDDETGTKKKDDDVNEDTQWIMGLVEMNIMLVNMEDAILDPVGKKRNEPNHSPFLEKPHRKSFTNFWLISRITPCIRYYWKYYGSLITVWIVIILLIAISIYFLANTWPIIFSHLLMKLW